LDIFKSQITNHKSQITTFIFEPLLQGTAGMVMYDAASLEEMIRICHENNILIIADEVMTGFGRTGKFFATDYLINKPDIICMSKGITGGAMAFGATSCANEIYNTFLSEDKLKTLFHGHSYTANPVACAAACASLDILEREETWENISRISKQHQQFRNEVASLRMIKNCRVLGTVMALEISSGESGSYFNTIRDSIYNFFIEEKVILRPLGNTVYVLPPYCIKENDLETVYTVIKKAAERFGAV
jgi:adenosylmethionine-8-amino-7-oxononanoate aminotransferase